MKNDIDVSSLSREALDTLIANHERKGATQSPLYGTAIAERSRRKSPTLKIDRTVEIIRDAARKRRFISYGELARDYGFEWSSMRYQMSKHLDAVLGYCYDKGWPLITAIVVNQQHLKSGDMEASSLTGFVAGARRVGMAVVDERAFMLDQQEKTFVWAVTEDDGS